MTRVDLIFPAMGCELHARTAGSGKLLFSQFLAGIGQLRPKPVCGPVVKKLPASV
jgi:hypothetical protein